MNQSKLSNKFSVYLKNQRLIKTSQRESVLSNVLNGDDHFDAEDLLTRIRETDCKASRATVYRTLRELERAGVIRKLEYDPEHAHYERADSDLAHTHMRCEKCGCIVELRDDTMHTAIRNSAQKKGWTDLKISICVTGICEKCHEHL
jgi:Fur family ferric uptake transcriptional regulator